MTLEHIIEIEHLCKSFGDVKAVNDLSFHVSKGELFAFLGVNGAGKSTTISIMSGRLGADSGTVRVGGVDVATDFASVARKIGVVFQSSALDKAMSVKDNLRSRAALYGITGRDFQARLSELEKLLDLEKLLPRTLGTLSGGQRRRIDIARALLHKPELIILDEPTTGLDPQTRRMLWDVIGRLRRDEGLTVFLTTHYMEEAADADYVVIIDSGRKAAEGTPLELKNRYTGDFITVYGSTEAALEVLNVPCEEVAGGCRIAVKNTAEATQLITAYPELFSDYEVIKGKMDDVFLAVTGRTIGGEK